MRPVKVFKLGIKVVPNKETMSSYWIDIFKEMGVQYGYIKERRGTRGKAVVYWIDHKGVHVYTTSQITGRDYSELLHCEDGE